MGDHSESPGKFGVGAPGDDKLYAGGGSDYLDGQEGADELWGKDGEDDLFGVSPNSVPSADEKMYGGGGDDTIRVADAVGGDFVDCGPGIDEAWGDTADEGFETPIPLWTANTSTGSGPDLSAPRACRGSSRWRTCPPCIMLTSPEGTERKRRGY